MAKHGHMQRAIFGYAASLNIVFSMNVLDGVVVCVSDLPSDY